MYKDKEDNAEKAKAVSGWLANPRYLWSHGRHIPRADVEEHELTTIRLEEDEVLQDPALSVFHATTHTFTSAPAFKIVESHTGRAFIKSFQPPVPSIPFGVAPTPPGRSGAR